jgi:hypothetical protein
MFANVLLLSLGRTPDQSHQRINGCHRGWSHLITLPVGDVAGSFLHGHRRYTGTGVASAEIKILYTGPQQLVVLDV